jgi:ankyrin repeat protein
MFDSEALLVGVDVNVQDKEGRTPLFIALISESDEAIQILLNQPNINIALKDTDGLAPVNIAAQSSPNMLRLLLKHETMNVDDIANDSRLLIVCAKAETPGQFEIVGHHLKAVPQARERHTSMLQELSAKIPNIKINESAIHTIKNDLGIEIVQEQTPVEKRKDAIEIAPKRPVENIEDEDHIGDAKNQEIDENGQDDNNTSL